MVYVKAKEKPWTASLRSVLLAMGNMNPRSGNIWTLGSVGGPTDALLLMRATGDGGGV